MSDQTDPRTRLVAETFADDWASGPAHTFALRAAAHARRRRTVRQLAVGSGIAAAVAATVFLSTRTPAPSPSSAPRVSTPALQTVASVSPTPAVTPAPLLSKISPAFEIISDDELFAELHGRPLLILPQERGERRILVLAR